MKRQPPDEIDTGLVRWQESDIWDAGPQLRHGNSFLTRFGYQPLRQMFATESSPGLVLLGATAVALIWANSPWSDYYVAIWGADISVHVGAWSVTADAQRWVNDALMVIFFFVVGLEIKHELSHGQLKHPRVAAVPLVAALGGMAVPALIYASVAGGAASHGWGIPMATDIAFAVGVLSLLGRRVPAGAKVFLLTLAIADDIGAIAVIAVFYTSELSLSWLGVTALCLLAVIGLRLLRVWTLWPYVIVGVCTWFAMYQSGVHPTVTGVVLGLLTPAAPLLRPGIAYEHVGRMVAGGSPPLVDGRELTFLIHESHAVVRRLHGRLEPFSNFLVLPVFALANAGVALGPDTLRAAATSPVTVGVFLGLVVGKVVGITATTWIATTTGLGRLPADVRWSVIAGVGLLGGIGFTVAIFIAGLSFPRDALLTEAAKIGILAGSVGAALLGLAYLAAVTRPERSDRTPHPIPAEKDA